MKASEIYSSIGRAARLYDAYLKLSGYQDAVECLVGQLPLEKSVPLQALDAGCGTGLYSLAVLKHYPRATVTAFDLNAKFIERLKQKLHENNFENRAEAFAADIQGPLREMSEKRFDL